MKWLVFILLIFVQNIAMAQIDKIEPPNWWVDFEQSSLQLLIKGKDIGSASVEINYPGVTLAKVNTADSPNYLFLDLIIDSNTKPGNVDILFKIKNKTVKKVKYELKSRAKDGKDYLGFDNTDVIYLITPDRFANGDSGNDIIKGLKESTINRQDNYARHGGDIKGITQHLDYINTMGFTAIWSSPLLTNDMPTSSYHGYAMTDFYEVDPRFGTLEEYQNLSAKAREKGIKLIMDQVANHCGLGHWWMQDLPFKDWVNFQDEFEKGEKIPTSNHRRTTNQDFYASTYDTQLLREGWFVDTMPDLNQKNSFMATYLIQNSIWWVETLQLGGIRQDTYPYPDKSFMATWAKAIMTEYPNFSIVGEEWSYNPLLVGYWQNEQKNKDGYVSHLSSSMDFPMQQLIVEALTEEETWQTGLVKIYEGLANDFAYAHPEKLLIFPDNHDMSRIYTQLNEEVTLTKMALAYILALPRIVQIYYGTEILMNDTEKPGDHGLIRSDFPGGWQGDTANAFTGEGLNSDQKDMQLFLKTLLQYRKNSNAIAKGKTIHFAPQNNIYILSRAFEDEHVLIVLNKNDHPVSLPLNRLDELGLSEKSFYNLITKKPVNLNNQLNLNQKGVLVLSTKM